MNFNEKLKYLQDLINQGLDDLLPKNTEKPAHLHDAMRYSMNAGGKRIRPILVFAAHEIFPSDLDPLPAAIAVECIHTYSLIHDDLPAMDDSALRRGMPSCHIEYDEATAILAGDAFQPLAFELLSNSYSNIPEISIDLIKILSSNAGSRKLVGGQMQDLLSEGQEPNENELSYIHSNKTAAMIRASLEMGLKLGKEGFNEKKLEEISQVGHSLGLAFQAIDDLLDITQTTSRLGKDADHDSHNGKITWISLKGESEARKLAIKHSEDALNFLKFVGGDSVFLSELINFMLIRDF